MKDAILLRAEGISIPAILNDTVAARDFKRRLPLILSGVRSGDCYRFPAARGCFDPEETQSGWRDGDISISGGWLRVFFGGEEASESSAGIMVIARINKRDLALVEKLPHNARLRIEAAEHGV